MKSQGKGKKLGSLMDLGFPIYEVKMVLVSLAYTTEKWGGSSERRALRRGHLYRSTDLGPARHQTFSQQWRTKAGTAALDLMTLLPTGSMR